MSQVEESQVRQAVIGVALLVCGTICFASKSILMKRAYAQGATSAAVLLFRHSYSLCFEF
ncbi:hypothetical protein P8907_02090 [Bacillus atrophaeus]|uniref:hypothetical protein n=2 Tax=Bacillus atrophaeus TaxID=1452 RepID=UPI00115AD671|nr:hypothetical protein [Bacillus atrophaeus]MCY7944924.1 hypothetical protein [Bacillus atrophaeus]MCY8095663.1 hypothetical protein [Bacillus atrophaeus]MCY8497100.1 hypothetical protein [Bacillus atrophaeus]MCY8828248.1 hypothetical protein [Bacillus atrophaeus]MCY8839091.1 hypothetical protein [Bacillus atrophaeus]